MPNSDSPNVIDFAPGKQEEEATKRQEPNEEFHWPWDLTTPCGRVLNRARTFAYILRSPETTPEHLIAMLAQDEAGQREMGKRGYQAEAAFQLACSAVLSKDRLTHDSSAVKAAASDALSTIMKEAEEIAQGCEPSPRAVSISDVVDAITRRPDADPTRALMSAKLPLTPAQEARDGVRSVERLLQEESEVANRRAWMLEQGLAALRSELRADLAVASSELRAVQALAAKTANDNDLQWARTKKVMFAVAGLIIVTNVLIGADGGHSLRLALAWFSQLIT